MRKKQIILGIIFGSFFYLKAQKKSDFDNNFIDALKEKAIGNYTEAIAYFEICKEINPKEAASYYHLAVLFLQKKRFQEAEAHIKQAVALDPGNMDYLQFNARITTLDQAEPLYEKIIASSKGTLKQEFLQEWIGVLIQAKEYEKAIIKINQYEKQIGFHPELVRQKYLLYIQLNQLAKAIKELENLTALYPREKEYLYWLVDVLLANNQNKKAEKYLRKILENYPQDFKANSELLKQSKDPKQIFNWAKQAFNDPEVDITAQIKLFFYLLEKKKITEKQALAIIEELTLKNPTVYDFYALTGEFAYKTADFEKAKINFEKYLQKEQSNSNVWNQYCLTLLALSQMDSLLVAAERAQTLFFTQGSYLYFQGVVYMQKRDYTKAIVFFEKSLSLIQDNLLFSAQILAFLADAYYELKQLQKAYNFYEESLLLVPDNAYVLNNYSYHLALNNENLEKAEKYALKANELMPNQSSFEDTYAWILFLKGDYPEALRWSLRAYANQKEAKSSEISEHLGDIYFALNQVDLAVQYWEESLHLGSLKESLQKKIKQYKDK